MITILKNMLEERREKPNKVNTEFFDYVFEELKQDNTILTEEIELDLMFVLLFASFETISMALLASIKLLTDNPQALKELTVFEEVYVKLNTFRPMNFTLVILCRKNTKKSF